MILELSVTISRCVALLEASASDPTQSSDDLAAFAWIQGSLEDVEDTVIGLSGVPQRFCGVSRILPLLLLEIGFP